MVNCEWRRVDSRKVEQCRFFRLSACQLFFRHSQFAAYEAVMNTLPRDPEYGLTDCGEKTQLHGRGGWPRSGPSPRLANGLATFSPTKRVKSRSPVRSSETPCSKQRAAMCASCMRLPVAAACRMV